MAFAFCLVSAGFNAFSFYLEHEGRPYWRSLQEYNLDAQNEYPLNFPPILAGNMAVMIGVVGLAYLIASCLLNRRSLWTFLHIGAVIFLLPSVYVFIQEGPLKFFLSDWE